jgi:hypothetical protein
MDSRVVGDAVVESTWVMLADVVNVVRSTRCDVVDRGEIKSKKIVRTI